MKCFHLIGVFIRASFQREAAFRFNFGTSLVNTVLNIVGSIGGVFVVFSVQDSLNGWEYRQVVILMGVYLLVLGMKDLVIGPSLEALSGLYGELWTGAFDYTLLKPLPLQFFISFRKWSLWSVLDIVFAVVLLLFSQLSGNGSTHISVTSTLLFLCTLFISMVLIYSMLLLLGSAAFWYLGTPLMWIFDSLIQTGRFPVGIYPGFLRFMLTWLIPVGFIITVPAQTLSGAVDIMVILAGALLACLLFVAATTFFNVSVRKYASASS